MLNKGVFKSLTHLRNTYPIGKEGWYAFIYNEMYIRDIKVRKWIISQASSNWGTIFGNINNQADLIALLEEKYRGHPKDYNSGELYIKQYENYGIWNPMVNDGVIINDGTLIIN